jgi:hypothetical protein
MVVCLATCRLARRTPRLDRIMPLPAILKSRQAKRFRRPTSVARALCEVIWKRWDTPWGNAYPGRERRRARNLLSKNCWRMALADKITPSGPEMPRCEPPARPVLVCGRRQLRTTQRHPSTMDAALRESKRKGENNSIATAVASRMWPTPASRDYRFPNKKPYCERGGGTKGEQLPNAVGGALNPTWVAWLMGYPPEWVNCAPSAMPSSRRSQRSS